MRVGEVFRRLIDDQRRGRPSGLPSICSAHPTVLEAAMLMGLERGGFVLIEATSNQVNQYGGYSGMRPRDFVQLVASVARKVGFPLDRVIIGGDHLGPNPWRKEGAASAMDKAARLVREATAAGFKKIHLDASMPLGGEPGPLDPGIVAKRQVALCRAAEEGLRDSDDPEPPVYIVGSEVPTPGGAQAEERLVVTSVRGFRNTVETCRSAFESAGLAKAWDRVIAVVVQPGVEFGEFRVHDYDRKKTGPLSRAVLRYPHLMFEAHSTDYQRPEALRALVEDHFGILKVGPALTFALREGLFLLAHIEEEILKRDLGTSGFQRYPSNMVAEVERAMAESTGFWREYHHGTAEERRFAGKYSLYDRIRYYWKVPRVSDAVRVLLRNTGKRMIPPVLLSQYFPREYPLFRSSKRTYDPADLLRLRVMAALSPYYDAGNPDRGTEEACMDLAAASAG